MELKMPSDLGFENIPIPSSLYTKLCEVIKTKIDTGVCEPSNNRRNYASLQSSSTSTHRTGKHSWAYIVWRTVLWADADNE